MGGEAVPVALSDIDDLAAQLAELRAMLAEVLARLGGPANGRRWYSVEEVARVLRKRPYTVREWCRLGQVNAAKAPSGSARLDVWRVSAEELDRVADHGLLPMDPARNADRRVEDDAKCDPHTTPACVTETLHDKPSRPRKLPRSTATRR